MSRAYLLAALAASLGLACEPPPDRAFEADDEQSTPDRPVHNSPDPHVPGVQGDDALQAELDAVLASKGERYEPRTHHLHPDGRPKFTNRLINESSPYLLQHAHNPVNWYAWGDAPFERAKREGKPVLLSIGYSTCHWCHVMERESFEDEEIAAYMNQNYVAIKVDREQRPDIDDVYMSAVQMLAGRGGWPMTVVLTPDREPFFGGTYFPPRTGERGARKGFLEILQELRKRYDDDPDEVVAEAKELSQKVAHRSGTRSGGGRLAGPDAIERATRGLVQAHDTQYGGFGTRPKFPRPSNFDLLMRHARRTGREPTEVLFTLDKMIAGGIHDQVGGGFHRYSVDEMWLVPHFEKMLYDNAQLAIALTEAWQVTGEQRYRAAAIKTLDYLVLEMSAPEGGFYSATDADSLNPETGHADEGWFFTWSQDELDAVLGKEAAEEFSAAYSTSGRGNFEGRNILHMPRPLSAVAKTLGVPEAGLAERLAESRAKLYAERKKRPAPLLDDKVLTSWNGLAISAFARAGFAFERQDYIRRATLAASFILDGHRDPGEHDDKSRRLLRSSRNGKTSGPGYLDDYAFFTAALLDSYEVTGNPFWLEEAIKLQDQLKAHYADPEGGFFMTADDAEALLVRAKPDYDGAEPSGNSVAAMNLLRIAEFTSEAEYRELAEKSLRSSGRLLQRNPGAVPKMACALDWALDRPRQVFVVYPVGTNLAELALLDPLRSTYAPNRIVALVQEDHLPKHVKLVPGLEMKVARGGKATAYVCENNVCQLPTSDPKVLAKQLAEITPYEG